MVDVKWVETCAAAGEFLYGYYPLSVLKRMYETRKGYRISDEDLIETMEKSDAVLMEYLEGRLLDFGDYGEGFFAPIELEGTSLEAVMTRARRAGNPYAGLHVDEEERSDLFADQDDHVFYLPSEAEIVQLTSQGYIRTPEMTALENRIRAFGGDPDFLRTFWGRYSTGQIDSMDAVREILGKALEKVSLPEEKPGDRPADVLKELMPLINGFLNSIHMRQTRGWQPSALFRKMNPHGMKTMPTLVPGSVKAAEALKKAEAGLAGMGVRVSYDSIDSFPTVGRHGERRVVKVGRNDPCPCGSGKKYKRCHGR